MKEECGERNLLVNGRFLNNLDGWSIGGDAAYYAGDGREQYGVVALPNLAKIWQQFAVESARVYTLHLAVNPPGTLAGSQAIVVIEDAASNTVLQQNLSGTGGSWNEQTYTFGLGPGTTFTLTVKNNSAGSSVLVDDVWLWWVPLTRAELASRVESRLDALASDRGYSTAASGALTEGDYTYAVDAGLRVVGAINPETDLPDVRYLDANKLNMAIDAIEGQMLERMARSYALEVDTTAGSRRSSFSQISKAVQLLAGEGNGTRQGRGTGQVISRKMKRKAGEYEFE